MISLHLTQELRENSLNRMSTGQEMGPRWGLPVSVQGGCSPWIFKNGGLNIPMVYSHEEEQSRG